MTSSLVAGLRAPAPFAATQRSRVSSWRLTTCSLPRERQEAPPPRRQQRRDDSRPPSRGDSRPPSRGDSRDPSRGDSRPPSRGDSRRPSRQQEPDGRRTAPQQGGSIPGRAGQHQQRRHEQFQKLDTVDIPVVRPGQANSSTFFSSNKFAELGASSDIIQALQALGITRPSHIQAASFRALSSGARHVVLADHAGSGKTLAYLLPLLQVLKEEEQILGGAATQPNCPRLVVVVPTAELCAQVLRVCRALSRAGLRLRSSAATGGHSMRTQREALDQGVDVLVGTPGRLSELLTDGCLQLTFCRAVVCDEVDVLLGEDFSFADQVRPLHAAAPDTTRFVFATATIPEQVYLDLEEEFPGLVAALGPGLHRTAPGITEQLVDCSGGDEVNEETGFQRKAAALFAVLQEQRAPRAIVFCNKIETCRKVENFLNRTFGREDSVEVLPHHAAIADGRRDINLRRFLVPPGASNSNARRRSGGSSSGGRDPERLVLVCTDRASRGMDSAFVEHVVLFDMPRDPSEYLRRVGRTTRGAGGSGVVSVLALGRQVKLAKEIIDRNQGGLALHRIPAALPVAAGPSDAERLRSDLAAAAAAAAAAVNVEAADTAEAAEAAEAEAEGAQQEQQPETST